MPIALLIGAVVWAVTFYSTRYVSLASLMAAVAIPIAAFFLREPTILLILTIVVSLIVILRHRTNIQRLFAGTESKFGKKTAAPKS
jgi:glycerol-3-phosphate acyltransferase PlsY